MTRDGLTRTASSPVGAVAPRGDGRWALDADAQVAVS